MRAFRIFLPILAILGSSVVLSTAQVGGYVPQAQFCFPQAQTVGPAASPLCSVIPGNISPDPAISGKNPGYKGIIDADPQAPSEDAETPFDNYSWQTFVGLNWTNNKQQLPAKIGMDGNAGPRVWQSWSRVAQVFGNSPVQANCQVPEGYEEFSMGSNGHGQPTAQNEEYIQAATLKPAIDVNGNFTLYERRVNQTEIAYLQNPSGGKHSNWNLTTYLGQFALESSGGKVDFPATGATQNGAMEIKAAWRILDPAKHAENAAKYYTIRAVVAVAPDLVDRGTQAIVAPICVKVDLGLVGMHIIQKNVVSNNQLKPEWFWTTFEHVDNAPMASKPCDITKPGACPNINQTACPTAATGNYSYYDPTKAAARTNFPASPNKNGAFHWNAGVPYAGTYLQSAPGMTGKAGTQVTRCWQIYKVTQELNAQWQAQLRAVGSVFANYMLIGTQWGASIEPGRESIGPLNAVPNYLSNSIIETFLQTFYTPVKNPNDSFNNGSCITCHNAATLVAGNNVSSNFSFLPGLVTPGLIRTLPARAGFAKPK